MATLSTGGPPMWMLSPWNLQLMARDAVDVFERPAQMSSAFVRQREDRGARLLAVGPHERALQPVDRLLARSGWSADSAAGRPGRASQDGVEVMRRARRRPARRAVGQLVEPWIVQRATLPTRQHEYFIAKVTLEPTVVRCGLERVGQPFLDVIAVAPQGQDAAQIVNGNITATTTIIGQLKRAKNVRFMLGEAVDPMGQTSVGTSCKPGPAAARLPRPRGRKPLPRYGHAWKHMPRHGPCWAASIRARHYSNISADCEASPTPRRRASDVVRRKRVGWQRLSFNRLKSLFFACPRRTKTRRGAFCTPYLEVRVSGVLLTSYGVKQAFVWPSSS